MAYYAQLFDVVVHPDVLCNVNCSFIPHFVIRKCDLSAVFGNVNLFAVEMAFVYDVAHVLVPAWHCFVLFFPFCMAARWAVVGGDDVRYMYYELPRQKQRILKKEW